jgi:hypothetical protein
MLAATFALAIAAAQPPAGGEQARFAECLDLFLAEARRVRPPVAYFANALATACAVEERAYRTAALDAATARGTPYLTADTAAFDTVLALRTARRDAYLAAQPTCVSPTRER